MIVPAVVPVPGSAGGTAYFLGRTPVTNAEYGAAVDLGAVAAPPWWRDPDFSRPGQPVVGVRWDEAAAYAEWLSSVAGGRWRLPTEAEWEWAAAAGRAAPPTPWGDVVPGNEIPEGPLSGPWDVGRGTPNAFGLCDVGTSVHEWCLDWRRPGRRASRGGSWRHAIRWSAPTASSSLPPTFQYSDYGFRVLREA